MSSIATQPHTVIVHLEAVSGKEETLKALLEALIPQSSAESTCINYFIYQDKQNPTHFVMYEKWTSAEDHALQFEKPHILDFANKVEMDALLAKPYQITFAEHI